MQLGWFSTGRDEAARNLLMEIWKRRQSEELEVDIPFVFCNREPGEATRTREGAERERFFAMVEELGIEIIAVSHLKVEPEMRKQGLAWTEDHSEPSPTLIEWRNIYGQRVLGAIEDAGYAPDFCILAGYMLIWSPVECEALDGINLHPALPWGPTGTWQEVIWTLMALEAEEQGVMMHLVTPELDRGPPVAYCRFPITGGDWDGMWTEVRERGTAWIMREQGETYPLFRRIRVEGERRELPLIAHTVEELASGRLEVRDKWPYNRGQRLESGSDLTGVVEMEMSWGEGR